MDIDTENRPLCKCHSIKMFWHKDKRSKAGGYWECKNKKREQGKNWDKTKKGKLRSKRYYLSPKGRLSNNKALKKFRDSPHGYISRRKYLLSKMREENLQRLEKLQEENPWLTN